LLDPKRRIVLPRLGSAIETVCKIPPAAIKSRDATALAQNALAEPQRFQSRALARPKWQFILVSCPERNAMIERKNR
jgi:hypothetical protein